MEWLLLLLLVGAAFVFGLPIAVGVLFARTRRLESRLEALARDVHGVREVHAVPAVREVPKVPDVPRVQDVPKVPEATEVREQQAPDAPLTPPAPPPPPAGPPPPAPTPRVAAPESLETAIGTRWLLYIGIVAIVVGVAYFEKLAIEYGWIGETARVVQGAVAGLALMFAGMRFARRGYAAYGQIMTGGGGAILYLSTYAAFNFYSLIARPVAFALMVAITVFIAWLADRERSQGLAVFAVGGGFVTPFLLPGTTDAQIALFTYDAILIAGTAVLSHRRDWPLLHLVSYMFTVLTVAAWADRFYTPAKYLRTELYLTLFCAMFVYVAVRCRRSATDAGKLVWLILWTAPAAYYLASLAILTGHHTALLAWLVAVMLTGGIVASRFGAAPGLALWFGATLPLLVWCATEHAQSMRREGLIALAAIYAIALLAELEGTILRDEPRAATGFDVAWIHLNPLATSAGAYLLLSPVSLVNTGYLVAAFAAWHAAIGGALWRRRVELAVHFVAVAFTLAAIAIALIFRGAAITAGWSVEGTAVILLAIRQRLAWLRAAGVVLLAVAIAQALDLLSAPVEAGHVMVFNARAGCAALIVGLCYLLAWNDWRGRDVPGREWGMGAALLTAQFLTLAALTSEINAYWAIHNGHLERELTLSVVWGVYAAGLVLIGLARDYAPIRYFAICVLALTIGKVFFVDMAELDRIYRVGSVVGLGIVLLITSYLYNRSRKGNDDRNGR